MGTKTEQGHEAIQRLLKENERTYAWLARNIGLNESHVFRIAKGERPIMPAVAVRLARVFDCDPSVFLPVTP